MSNWKRGAPQNILFPDQTTRSAVIDNNGLVSSVTDERTNQTSYGYDVLGRLTAMSFPTGDTQAWVPKNITYVPLTASELGIPAGSWRMRLVEANHQKSVYFDARYNPVLDEERDLTTSEVRYIHRAFDYAGRATFQSYPSIS